MVERRAQAWLAPRPELAPKPLLELEKDRWTCSAHHLVDSRAGAYACRHRMQPVKMAQHRADDRNRGLAFLEYAVEDALQSGHVAFGRRHNRVVEIQARHCRRPTAPRLRVQPARHHRHRERACRVRTGSPGGLRRDDPPDIAWRRGWRSHDGLPNFRGSPPHDHAAHPGSSRSPRHAAIPQTPAAEPNPDESSAASATTSASPGSSARNPANSRAKLSLAARTRTTRRPPTRLSCADSSASRAGSAASAAPFRSATRNGSARSAHTVAGEMIGALAHQSGIGPIEQHGADIRIGALQKGGDPSRSDLHGRASAFLGAFCPARCSINRLSSRTISWLSSATVRT